MLRTHLCDLSHSVTRFVPQLIITGAFGRNQFAYTPERGARDATAQLVLAWMNAVGSKFSRDMRISDMIYQGTLLGFHAWNIFYEYAADAARLHDF